MPRTSKPGGGIGIIYNSLFGISIVELPQVSSFETFTIQLYTASSTLHLSVVYRPPDLSLSTFISEFDNFLEISHDLRNHIICGDFNLHFDDVSNSYTAKFRRILKCYNLTQHVKDPTHNQGHILDYLITSSDSDILRNISTHDTGISDHYLISCDIHLNSPQKSRSKRITYRSWKSFDFSSFELDVVNSDICKTSIIENASSSEYLISIYNHTLSSLLDKHSPLKTAMIPCRRFSPWFTQDIRCEIRKRRKLERSWRTSRLNDDWQRFNDQRIRVKILVKTAKRTYFTQTIAENSTCPNRLWSTIRSLIGTSPSSTLPTYDHPVDCANNFVSFFSKKVDDIRRSFPQSHSAPMESGLSSSNFSSFQSVSSEEVSSFISSRIPKTCPLDPCPSWLVKKLHLNISLIITRIINISMSTGTFPSSEKNAVVTPLLKKRGIDKESLANYRPVSGLSFISKIIEHFVAKQLNLYLSTNALLDPHQSAFRTGFSTETALLKFHNDLTLSLDQPLSTCSVMLDISAAFDTVDYEILQSRLQQRFGITGTALSWFASYLTGRSQMVQIDGVLSDPAALHSGVPQGSILGPVLFSLYTSPISSVISSYNIPYLIYADDTTIYISFKVNEFAEKTAILQDCVVAVSAWFNDNMLKLNPSKTDICIFGPRSQLSQIPSDSVTICETDIEINKTVKLLGVTFDSVLSFDAHVSNICRISFHFISMLYRIRNFIDESTCILIINCFIHTRLDYCNSILYGCTSKNIKRLQRVQNCSARLVKRLPRTHPTSEVVRSLHWLPIEKRINFKICSLVYRCLHGNAPTYLKTLVSPVESREDLRSRSSTRLYQPVSRNAKVNSSFKFCGPHLWNNLPDNVRSEPDYAKFKRLLKTHYFNV